MNKKLLMTWHSWFGLKLSILMLIICFTGTLAVVSHEIDWLLDSDLRIEAQDKEIQWQAMTDTAKQAFPQRELGYISAPLYSNFASVALMSDPQLGARRVYLNPYTGELLADSAWYASAQRILRDLHRYLLSPVAGIYIVGPFAIALMISLITALFYYKKWWRGFFKLRLNNGTRAFWGSLHKVIGLWSIWFIFIIAATGIWYLAEALIRDAGVDIQFDRPKVDTTAINNRGFIQPEISVEHALLVAKKAMGYQQISHVFPPKNQKTPYYITGYTDAILVRPRSNSVYIDPVNGELIKARKTEDQGALEIWIDMADPLHFGDFAGLTSKLIWFIFGLLLCIMSASGIVIYLKRIKARMNNQQGFFHRIVGNAKYATAILLFIPVLSGSYIIAHSNGWIYKSELISSITVKQNDLTLNLTLLQQDKLYYLSVQPACRCLLKPAKMSIELISGESIPIKRHTFGRVRRTAALLTPEQLPLLSTINWHSDNIQHKVFKLSTVRNNLIKSIVKP